MNKFADIRFISKINTVIILGVNSKFKYESCPMESGSCIYYESLMEYVHHKMIYS